MADAKPEIRFPTATGRDRACTSWAATGGVLINGMTCSVAGVSQIYRAGQWRDSRTA